MKILTRYILKEAITYFLITLFAFTALLLTVRMLHFASLIVNKGVSLLQIGEVFLSLLPSFLEFAIPMATLLGIMLAFARFSGDSEIIVIRASGISVLQLVRPILLFGAAAATINLYVSLQLKPWGFANLNRVLFEIARSKSTSGLTEGVFNPLGDLTLYSEKIDDVTGSLSRVMIDDRRDSKERKIIFAQRGEILSDEARQLITIHLGDGYIHEVIDKRYVTTKFIDNFIQLRAEEIFESDEAKKDKSPRELSLPQIQDRLSSIESILEIDGIFEDPPRLKRVTEQLLRENALPPPALNFASKKDAVKRHHRLETEAGGRFSTPFAAMLLALVALPLGIIPPRTQKTFGIGLSLLCGLGVFVVYYGSLTLGIGLAERGVLSGFVSVWLPNVVVLAISTYFIKKIGREEWHSVIEGLQGIFSRVRFRVRRARSR